MDRNENQVINYNKSRKSYFEVVWTYQEDVRWEMAKHNISLGTTMKKRARKTTSNMENAHQQCNETKGTCTRRLRRYIFFEAENNELIEEKVEEEEVTYRHIATDNYHKSSTLYKVSSEIVLRKTSFISFYANLWNYSLWK